MRINENTSDDPIRIKLRGKPTSPDNAPSNAERWVRKIYAKLPKNPLNPEQLAMVFGEGEDQQLALFEIRPSMSDPDAAYINWFQAYPQRQGVGTKAMQQMQELAAKDGIKLILNAWTKGKVPEKVLKRFYTNMGFQSGKSREGMIWEPDLKEAIDAEELNTLIRDVTQAFADRTPWEALYLMGDAKATVNDSPALKDVFEKNLHQLANLVIREMVDADADAGMIESDRSAIMRIGIEIPNSKITDHLRDSISLINKSLRNLIKHGQLQNAMLTIVELREWGLSVSLEANKDQIIRMMLQEMKAGSIRVVSSMISIFKENGIHWPEFAAFEKSIAASTRKSISEDDSQENKMADLFAKVSRSFMEKQPYDVLEWMEDADIKITDNPALKALFDANMHQFAKLVTDEMRYGEAEGYTFERIREMMELIGIDMDNDKLVDALWSKRNVIDRGFQMMIQHGDYSGAMGVMAELQHWGLNYYLEDFVDLEEDKDEIIKSMLLHMKQGQTAVVGKMIDGLDDMGVDWPELDAFSKSLAASKKKLEETSTQVDQLDVPTPSVADLAVKYDVSVHDVLRELAKGVKVEQEHTTKLDVAREIALDHLGEDLYYYVKLAGMEKKNG